MRRSVRSLFDTIREISWLRRNLHIRPTDFVLDVGSGGNPNLRSNVLCDKFLADGAERHGSPVIVDRPFVAGDVQRLPFKDASFDYVILSHVLEHLPNPGATLAELQRVARRGYIETPSAVFEKIHGYPFHRWLVSEDGEGLLLRAKTKKIHDPEIQAWFEQMQSYLRTGPRLWSHRRSLGVYTCHEWEGEIHYRVEGAPEIDLEAHKFVRASLDHTVTARIRGPKDGGPLWRSQQWLSRHMRGASDRPWPAIRQLLCCPGCRGDLSPLDPASYRCDSCGGTYPVDPSGIPLLLIECRQSPQVSFSATATNR